MRRDPIVYDLFAGIGGWDLALGEKGFWAIGVENNRHVVATRNVCKLPTWEGDVTGVTDWAGLIRPVGIVASPPCQAFSQATRGKRLGDPRGQLVFEPLRWAAALSPDWVALEQVKGAQSHFDVIAEALDGMGYSTWVGIVNAADYGVPQARLRCLMLASRVRTVRRPLRTHDAKGADGRLPLVTMSDALPKRLDLPDWCALRPSTTVVGSFRPEMQAAPGWRKPGDPPRQNTPESVKLSLSERLVLQGFPPDFPVQGPRTARDLQVGNAIPPRLAKAAVEAVAGGIRA